MPNFKIWCPNKTEPFFFKACIYWQKLYPPLIKDEIIMSIRTLVENPKRYWNILIDGGNVLAISVAQTWFHAWSIKTWHMIHHILADDDVTYAQKHIIIARFSFSEEGNPSYQGVKPQKPGLQCARTSLSFSCPSIYASCFCFTSIDQTVELASASGKLYKGIVTAKAKSYKENNFPVLVPPNSKNQIPTFK